MNLKSIFVLFIIIMLVGCTSKAPEQKVVTEPAAESEKPAESNAEAEPEAEEEVVEEPENELLGLCPKFENTEHQAMCEAAINKDLKRCDLIYKSEPADEYDAKANCRVWAAVAMGDVNLCNTIDRTVPAGKRAGVAYNEYKVECIEPMAIANKNKEWCSRNTELNKVTGCKKRYELQWDDVPLEKCAGYDYDCYFEFAHKHRDITACEMLDERSDDMMRRPRVFGCKGLVLGDVGKCDDLAANRNYWSYCAAKALYGIAEPEEGVIAPDRCEGNIECEKEVLKDIVYEAAAQD